MRRRDLVQGTTALATFSALSALSARRVRGANDRVNVGLIGCGVRGKLVTRLIRGTKEDFQATAPDWIRDGKLPPSVAPPRNVEVGALCDVWQKQIDTAREWAPQARGYRDFRKLLEDKDIHAVVIATHDPWHAAQAILAVQAGKDVYLEKPVMYSIREGRAMREAVRKSKQIVQVGTQHRAAAHIADAAKIVQSGRIGQVTLVRVWNFLNMPRPAPKPDADPPADLDWDFWLGPAPKAPFNPDRLGYRSFMDYTNGLISDYGMHRFDSVHQIMGVDTPLAVSSSWGRYTKTGFGDLPDVHQATYEYPGFILSYECCTTNSHGLGGRTPGMKYYGAKRADDRPHGMAYYGTEGALFVDRIGMELYPEPNAKAERMHMNEDEPTPLHTKQFIDAVRSRQEPAASIDVGSKSTIVPLIGNIAARTGRRLVWDGKRELFPNDPQANRQLFRPHRKPWDLVKIT